MKFKEVAALNEADQNKKLVEAQAELIKLNGQVTTGTALKSPGRIKQLKKTIARILTSQNQKKADVKVDKKN